jgi:hypothetical protein
MWNGWFSGIPVREKVCTKMASAFPERGETTATPGAMGARERAGEVPTVAVYTHNDTSLGKLTS